MRYLAINGHRSKVPFSTWNLLEHHQNSFLGPSWDLYGAIKISGFQSSPKKSLNRHYIGRASKFRVSKQSLLLAQITVQCLICEKLGKLAIKLVILVKELLLHYYLYLYMSCRTISLFHEGPCYFCDKERNRYLELKRM